MEVSSKKEGAYFYKWHNRKTWEEIEIKDNHKEINFENLLYQ